MKPEFHLYFKIEIFPLGKVTLGISLCKAVVNRYGAVEGDTAGKV